VIGPVVKDGAIDYGPVSKVSDLPVDWGDEQAPGQQESNLALSSVVRTMALLIPRLKN